MKPVETKYVLRYSDEVKINKNAPEFSSVSSVVHFCHDYIDVVQHDVCVVRGEGQGRSDPDGVVTAAS